MHHGQAIQEKFPRQNKGISEKRHGFAGFAARQRLGVALALAIAGVSSCASGRGAQRETTHSVSKVDTTWSFMTESQRKSAQTVLRVPCDEIGEAIKGSRAAEIVVHFDLIRATVDLQGALRRGNPVEIAEKAKVLASLGERMEEGEAARKFRELAENPDTAFEVKMIQDYMVPAVLGASELSRFEVE